VYSSWYVLCVLCWLAAGRFGVERISAQDMYRLLIVINKVNGESCWCCCSGAVCILGPASRSSGQRF
jgi:hypothetical protein